MGPRTAEQVTGGSRSGLASLLRRTPYTLLLRRCSIAGVQEEDTTGNVPRMYSVKVEDRTVRLRYWGYDPMNPTWSVKARMRETPDGVLLEGRVRYLLDRLLLAMFTAFTAIFLGVAIGLVVDQGWRSGGYPGALVGAATTGSLLLLHVGLFRRGMQQREEKAREILRGAFERG